MLIEEHIWNRIQKKKKRLDSLRPFPKIILSKLREYFTVEMTYNSNAIEGNTLSLAETRAVLEDGITIGGKSMREHLEVTNHKRAIDFIESLIRKKRIEEKDVLEINALILDRIMPNEAGFYRNAGVLIRGSRFLPPSAAKVPKLMKEFMKLLNKKNDNPLEHAAEVHFEFVHIHPFVDGNGRGARLLKNLILMRVGYPPSYILKTERKKYIDALEKAHRGRFESFFNLIAKSVERSLDLYLSMIDKKFDSDYMTLAKAAELCDYSQEYLSLLARKGRLEAIKYGRNWMISKTALNDYLKSVKKIKKHHHGID
jgi:excisionase family DNA binding protein